VDRSPALEGLDQLPPLLFGDAFHAEIQAHGVEQGDIRAHRVGAVDDAADIRRDAVQRNRLRLGQHLHQFDPASRHAREEQFGGIDGLAGAAVLHWPVHNEVMVAGAAQNAPESVRGSCLRRILAHVCIDHNSTSHLTLTYPSGTAVPFPEESGDCSLWMSGSGGGLFDERRDSNPSLGAFVFSPAVSLADPVFRLELSNSGVEVLRTMVEREMQELLWRYPERFLNEPLKQFAWETSSNVGRADLVFEDRHGRLLIIEVKRGKLLRGAIDQLLDYF